MAGLFVVTGGSHGLGRALVSEAANHGDFTASISRSRGASDEHLEADLSAPDSWAGVIDWIGELIDRSGWDSVIFVHNAATLDPIGFAGETPARAYTRQAFLNLTAPIVLGHGFLRLVNGRDHPSTLVQMTSGAATTAYPGWSGYGPAKAAVDHWVRTVARELEFRGSATRVVAVAPGVVDTDMQRMIRGTDVEAFPEVERFHALHADGRLAQPEEAASRLYRLVKDSWWDSGSILDLRSVD